MHISATNIDMEDLVLNKQKFNDFLYTPISKALEELRTRSEIKKIENFSFLPDNLKKPKAVLARHLITPNHEVIRFISITDALKLDPLFFEYHNDKMIYKNPWKYSLGKMGFYKGIGKKGGAIVEYIEVIDFNKSHGLPISKVKTLNGQSLIDFHHDFFTSRFPQFNQNFFNGSDWYSNNGGTPKMYYKKFLSLFLKNAILFENFLLDQKEVDFTKQIILPVFQELIQEYGVKPLIVALEPTDIEGSDFWLQHPGASIEWVKNKIS